MRLVRFYPILKDSYLGCTKRKERPLLQQTTTIRTLATMVLEIHEKRCCRGISDSSIYGQYSLGSVISVMYYLDKISGIGPGKGRIYWQGCEEYSR